MDTFDTAAFLLASFVVVIVPGPTVTVIIANSLRDGPKAGLLNVAGTQAGLLMMLAIVAFGLDFIVERMAVIFDWIRIAGAAYLIWLGVKLIRSDGKVMGNSTAPQTSYFVQGLLVVWSNPKALLFYGAFIPQFINPAGDALQQTLILGIVFMLVATIFDGSYAVLAGKAGSWLSQNNVRKIEKVSGSFLIFGGLWLALAKR